MGPDIPSAARTALFHYADKLKVGRRPLEIPPFLRDQASQEPELAFDLAVGGEAESLLKREAARQGTTLSALANHSVMVYLAELDFISAPAGGARDSYV